ncbi:hypothetical protein MMYC01_200489 [Madurella mycetomatis]|uniref:Uncharacterized protein n=1 Tax=Madurella mycetomatis TaxID=100816 RepID=A0A175WJC4_9PEZI|nr:hypothetical protein MMYC01_200489 [Madurella mycetomatis]
MALAWGGKLGEMLFDGSARVLVRLLAVPVRPQNPPETASSTPTQTRNGRCTTQMAAHDSAKDIRMKDRAKRKADGEVIAGASQRRKQAKTKDGDDRAGTDHSIIDHSIIDHSIIDHSIIDHSIIDHSIIDHSVTFSKLPPEVHRLVFTFIECIADVISLGLANHVSAKEEEICLDGHSTALLGRFSNLDISKDPAFDCIRSEMWVQEETYFPEDQQWILRNLTTKQFVRSEAIALKPELIHGPSISVLGFGEVVMSRICWSTSSFVSMSDAANISRGVWAGHRFDITTLARHRDETNEVGWSDVSDEVAREIAGIWESEYGANWRETPAKRAFSLPIFGKSTLPFSTFDFVEFGGVRREGWFPSRLHRRSAHPPGHTPSLEVSTLAPSSCSARARTVIYYTSCPVTNAAGSTTSVYRIVHHHCQRPLLLGMPLPPFPTNG